MALSFKEKRRAQVSLNTSLTRLSSGGLSFKDKRTEQGNVATQLIHSYRNAYIILDSL